MALDRQRERAELGVPSRQVAPNPRKADLHHNGADVAVLEFDRGFRPLDSFDHGSSVMGLHVVSAGKLLTKHGEIGVDEYVILLGRPVGARKVMTDLTFHATVVALQTA